jgi:hypothetical protein
MSRLVCIVAILFALFVADVSLVYSQGQILDGYTFVRSGTGPAVCLGRWVPPQDVSLPGVCEGELVDISYLTAISARLTADRLDQIITALSSLDQKLALNNDQVRQLIDVSVRTQTLIDEQGRQLSDILSESISRRFEDLPAEILSNELFKEEIDKLKADILKEVERLHPAKQAPAKQ